jgi:hypothetical protein
MHAAERGGLFRDDVIVLHKIDLDPSLDERSSIPCLLEMAARIVKPPRRNEEKARKARGLEFQFHSLAGSVMTCVAGVGLVGAHHVDCLFELQSLGNLSLNPTVLVFAIVAY